MAQQITFEEFQEEFMPHFDGYVPIYSSYENGTFHLELIAPWRMSDGPSRFYRYYEIQSVDSVQKIKICAWLDEAAKWWSKETKKHSADIRKSFHNENVKKAKI